LAARCYQLTDGRSHYSCTKTQKATPGAALLSTTISTLTSGFELYERLGRGGMATVYRALHLNLDREVAIKVMDPGMNADESFSERFIREARISAQEEKVKPVVPRQ
jgi:serine/threonine protein kinase